MSRTNRQLELMARARAGATFDSYKLTVFIYKGEDTVQKRRQAFARIEIRTNTVDTSKLPRIYAEVDREALYDDGLQWGSAAFLDGLCHEHRFFEETGPRHVASNSNPFGMTALMFTPTLKLQATDEQLARWLPLAESGRLVGAYCQTELGHGSFVRGLETTATFDQGTNEFVVDSPTLTSTKFWPGALGFAATHAIVVAQLVTGGAVRGPHHFIVQLRSLEDGTPLPGIELGDLGPKMAYNGTCNGFARFAGVRVPRAQMLARHARVERDGTYIASAHAKLEYGTMLQVRARIVRIVARQLAQATAIAVRYSVVREQGMGPNNALPAEVPIMAYKSQHYRLFKALADTYAIVFASWTCDEAYADLERRQRKDDHSTLAYVHGLLAGFKAWSTQAALDGAEDARRCCGGIGYLATSGLPEIVLSLAALPTLEGENFVLWQQLGRYLVKCVAQLKAGKDVDPPMRYLAFGDSTSKSTNFRCTATGDQFLDSDVQLAIFRHRAVRLIMEAAQLLERATASGKSGPDAWNEHMMSIIYAGRAHVEFLALQSFIVHAATVTDPATRAVLTRLRWLFALTTISNPAAVNAAAFSEDGHLSGAQLGDVRACVNGLLAELLPDAIALTDAWDFTDASLGSAIGMRDGNAYETLMAWTRQLPINVHAAEQGGVFKTWGKWVKPVLQAKL